MMTWMHDKLWVSAVIRERLGIDGAKLLFVDHHGSHAASAFYPSRFDEAAILTVDGVGEWTTASFGVGDGTNIRLLREIRFPHSLGLLYSVFTAFLGFEVNEGEYKVMGMAPYGEPRYVDKVWKLIEVSRDGVLPPGHGLLRVPLLARHRLQPEVHRPLRRATAAWHQLLHLELGLSAATSARSRATTTSF